MCNEADQSSESSDPAPAKAPATPPPRRAPPPPPPAPKISHHSVTFTPAQPRYEPAPGSWSNPNHQFAFSPDRPFVSGDAIVEVESDEISNSEERRTRRMSDLHINPPIVPSAGRAPRARRLTDLSPFVPVAPVSPELPGSNPSPLGFDPQTPQSILTPLPDMA
jgi:hypothetical protein